MNTPVSFKLAKLLKEERFNEPIKQRYFIAENIDSNSFPFLQKECALYNWNNYDDFSTSYYSAPTIADAVMWLYEKHGIWIQVKPGGKLESWDYIVQKKDNNFAVPYFEIKQHKPFFNSPTEAYEAAIKYCLTKLI